MIRWAVVALAAVGCSGRAGPAAAGAGVTLPEDLLRLAAPPLEIAYERKRVVGDIGLPLETVWQTWGPGQVVDGAIAFDVTTRAAGPDAAAVGQRWRYGADGLVIAAEGRVVDGALQPEPWEPPLLVLPRDAKAGARWEAEHTAGGERVARACELLVSEQCADGLVAVCDRKHDAFRLVTRDHFCPGVGWSGYESLLVRDGSPSVRTWTEEVRRAP